MGCPTLRGLTLQPARLIRGRLLQLVLIEYGRVELSDLVLTGLMVQVAIHALRGTKVVRGLGRRWLIFLDGILYFLLVVLHLLFRH